MKEEKVCLLNSIEDAYNYLRNKEFNGFYRCYISNDRRMINPDLSPNEIASSILILKTAFLYKLKDQKAKSIIKYIKSNFNEDYSFTFFENKKLLPPDAETTSIALSTLIKAKQITKEETSEMARKIAENKGNGKIQVYFNPETFGRENRFDQVSLSNICYFLYSHNLEKESENQLEEIVKFFNDEDYLKGSRYYFSPDSAIYFASQLIDFSEPKKRLINPLQKALKNRIGKTYFPLDLAMRITSATKLGISNDIDFKNLVNIQDYDGGFPSDAIYKRGSREEYFGSRELSTAFSIEALMTGL